MKSGDINDSSSITDDPSECGNYSTGRKFSLELNIAILLMANLLNLNFAYNSIFRNLTMIAHIIKFQISKFANV